ncbi:hypothetical protein BV898_19942 [Hypsibius exemplaris]|uniref:EIF2B subunit epsilon/gamma LbH domain-containing protein n=1 Tax=Hypsibius exemplaris TaxID=2072580 RepID=A0A9X6NMF0_HYPEX|nr:hypothetical protein BV898_19942 [Hypsibius exemplaris]
MDVEEAPTSNIHGRAPRTKPTGPEVPRILQALLPPNANPKFIHPGVVFQGKSQVGADSMIGEGTTVGDKVSIKKSIIGQNCRIAEKAKISNSVIMDDVTVAEK